MSLKYLFDVVKELKSFFQSEVRHVVYHALNIIDRTLHRRQIVGTFVLAALGSL